VTKPEAADPHPVDIIGTLVGILGKDATFELIAAKGGTRLQVPKRASDCNSITAIIGATAAEALRRSFGGDRIALPLAKPWLIRVYRERGLSYARIKRAVGCTEATVFKHLKSMGMSGPPATTRRTRLTMPRRATLQPSILEAVS
jgi:hypothetical protein